MGVGVEVKDFSLHSHKKVDLWFANWGSKWSPHFEPFFFRKSLFLRFAAGSSATTHPRALKKILPFRAFEDGQGCCFSTCNYNEALLLFLLLPLVFFRGLLPVLIWLLHHPSSLLLLQLDFCRIADRFARSFEEVCLLFCFVQYIFSDYGTVCVCLAASYESQLAMTPQELQTSSGILILSREKKTSWI